MAPQIDKENPAEDLLNVLHEVQMEDNAINFKCFGDTWRNIGHVLACSTEMVHFASSLLQTCGSRWLMQCFFPLLVMHLKIISFSLLLPPFCAFPCAHSTLIRPVIHLGRSVSCWYLLLSPPQRFYLSPSFPSRLPSTLPMQCPLRHH